MESNNGKPKLLYSRANIRELRKEALHVQAGAWMINPAPIEEDDLLAFPLFWAPPKGLGIARKVIKGYHVAPDMIDVHIHWCGAFTGNMMVLFLKYFAPVNATLKVAFDLHKYATYLRKATESTLLFLSFQTPPKHHKPGELMMLAPEDDPELIVIQATDKIQTELDLLLNLWHTFLEAKALQN